MTAIDFQPATGRLRLTQPQFESLVKQSAPGSAGTAQLVASGVFTPGGPHPLLKPGLAAVREPVCRLQVQVSGAAAVHEHQIWVGPEAAAYLLHSRDDVLEFLTTGPTFLPAALARIVGLAARTSVEFAVSGAPVDVLDALFDADPEHRREAAAVIAPNAGAWRAARGEIAWAGADEQVTGRAFAYLDTGAALFSVVEADADSATWEATTATAVWRVFAALLPTDADLRR